MIEQSLATSLDTVEAQINIQSGWNIKKHQLGCYIIFF